MNLQITWVQGSCLFHLWLLYPNTERKKKNPVKEWIKKDRNTEGSIPSGKGGRKEK